MLICFMIQIASKDATAPVFGLRIQFNETFAFDVRKPLIQAGLALVRDIKEVTHLRIFPEQY